MSKRKSLVLALFFSMFAMIFASNYVQAAGEPYTIDPAPLNSPSFDAYTTEKVSTSQELVAGLADSSKNNVIFEIQNDLTITGQTPIVGDKGINLNGKTLNATSSAYLLVSNTSTTDNFKLYNGTITGGIGNISIGADTLNTNGFFSVDYRKMTKVVFEDITYSSLTNGGGFFKGLNADVFVLGNVKISTNTYNLRSANMTFLGNFDGYAYGQGSPGATSNGSGGINLSFGGYNYSYRRLYGNQVLSQTNGDRRMYVGKDSHVSLKNDNSADAAYANNIGNFATVNVDGTLETTAISSSLRTTASSTVTSTPYQNQAGTYNAQSNFNINEGASFKTASTNERGNTGTLFTYYTDVNVYKPKIFDMRYYGVGNFFYSYTRSNLRIYDANIGVWNREDKGIGNPISIWQNVTSFELSNFYGTSPGTLVANPPSLNLNDSTFNISKYSRISNDTDLPMLIPDAMFIDSSENVFMNNGDTKFRGTTDYYLPGGQKVGEVAPKSTVTFVLDGKTYTTVTDDNGKWTFSDLDLSKVKGGTVGTLDLVDTDQRKAPQLKVTIKDTIAPIATPKLIQVTLGDTTALQDAKMGIATYSDETSLAANMKFSFATSSDDRTNMINKLGSYNVDINVLDEAGNKTVITSPVIVHAAGETITDGYVLGNNFNIDYITWLNSTESQKRDFLLDTNYGSVKGYSISGNTVTDVTSDTNKMSISMPTTMWEPNKTYAISVKVNSYVKKINVTLVPSTVKMSFKQVYKGTDTPIYSNLQTKLPVDNTRLYEETIGNNIEEIIKDKISSSLINLNYEGYDLISASDYKIYQNGIEVTSKPTLVPNEDFTVVYEYSGQLKFKEAANNLDFGAISITGDKSITPLSESSDSTVSIINTEQQNKWRLKASVPEGIKQTEGTNPKMFVGNILYKNSSGTSYIIGENTTVIENQNTTDLVSQVNLKAGLSGLFLQQNAGNLKGSYAGKLVWTLEDTPTP